MANNGNTNTSSNSVQESTELKGSFSYALFEYREQLRIRNKNFLRSKRSRMPITKKLSRDSMDLMQLKLWLADEMINHVQLKRNIKPWKAEQMKSAMKKRLNLQIQGLVAIQQEVIARAENGEEELIVDLYEDKIINPRTPHVAQESVLNLEEPSI